MALIACAECKKQISDEANACPHCGAKPKKGMSRLTILFLAVFGVVVYSCASSSGTGTGPTVSTPAREKSAAEKKADEELTWAVAAGRLLKKNAKDPSSFKIEGFLIFPGGAACYEYRAKNSFGAIVPAKAVFTPPSTLLTSENDKNRFVRAWNDICTKPGGAERAGGLNLLGAW